MMMKTQNGHNLASFEEKSSIFCTVIDLNDIYRMIMRMMKTQNGYNSANLEGTFSRSCMAIVCSLIDTPLFLFCKPTLCLV